MAHGLTGKWMLIAGGAKNLGCLLAGKLAVAGVGYLTVHYNSRKSQKAAAATKMKVEALGVKSMLLQGDLTTGPAMA